jgi:glycosyltransferase involved in cell wall biosynthesis
MGALLAQPEAGDWDITVITSTHTYSGRAVAWPEQLTRPNVRVATVPDELLAAVLDGLAAPGRLWGVPGTASGRRTMAFLLERLGPAWLHKGGGPLRSWIEEFCLRERFDLVYFTYPYLVPCPRLPMPMVATPHDFNYKRIDSLPRSWRARMDREMPEWLDRCARLVVSSEFIASEIACLYPAFAGKVRVVRLGIPGNSYCPSEADLASCRQRMGLPESFLMTAGWIAPHKNQRIIFQALGELRRRGVNIPLVCVGPNSDRLRPDAEGRRSSHVEDVVQTAEGAGLQYGKDCLGLGYVDDADIACLYRLATALIVPSLYEAGSFPAIEAMLAGCPVICSRIPPLAEQVALVEGNAWLYEPQSFDALASVIEEILREPERARETARRASDIVPGVYSWDKAAKGYLSAFEEALR